MRTLRRRPRGFTLIEILAAMAMFAVLIGALYSALSAGVKLRRTAQEAADRAIPRDQLIAVLRHDIENAVVPSGVLAAAMTLDTEGDNDNPAGTLSFSTTTGVLSDNEPSGDIRQEVLSLTDPEDGEKTSGKVLLRTVTKNPLDTTIDEQEQEDAEDRLVDGVASLDITVYDGTDWTDTWDSTTEENANPTAVKVRVTFAQDDPDVPAEQPIELVCLLPQQPRPTPVAPTPAAAAAGGGGGAGAGTGGGTGAGNGTGGRS